MTNTIATDTINTLTYDASVTYGITCTAKPDKPGVSLWQWVTTTSDGQALVFSTHTVCRYGENFNSSPKCPWPACKAVGGDCSECYDGWKM